ncbi:hypothetical protein GCM10027589_28970 [Actinocorallia lasiicapitis]
MPAVLVVALLVVIAVQMVRPLPGPRVLLAIPATQVFPGTEPKVAVPAGGQAAVEVDGLGTLAASGAQTPTPTASVAKVMTAYLFLKAHPLAPGQDGPSFTVSAEEAARLPWRKKRDETLINVRAGEVFTVRKSLQALMTVSANNIAHEIARWDSGDGPGFVAKMNDTARALGMTGTTYTDPSGYEPSTVSTAADQVKLLKAAFALPEFEQIVNLTSYTDSSGETRQAGNQLLGQDGVIGGKTGYTSVAGANYVFAARETEGTASTLIFGAVLHQPAGQGTAPALDAARTLIRSAHDTVTGIKVAAKGDTVARLDTGLGHRTALLAPADITVLGWAGRTVPVHAALSGRVANLTTGTTSATGTPPVPLIPAARPTEPDFLDRALRLG